MDKILSPAKINLGIAVPEKFADGWHEVSNVLMTIPFYDEMEIKILLNTMEIKIECNDRNVPTDEQNFIWQAIKKIREISDKKFGVKVILHKNIPAGGGFGGGSLNAASILKYLNQKLALNLPLEKLIKIAKQISGDSVFYLAGDSVYETQHGLPNRPSQLEILPTLPHCFLLIISPDFSIKIGEAYQNLDANFVPSTYKIENLVVAIKARDLVAIAKNMHNDFEQSASEKYPVIKKIREVLTNHGALGVNMNGKGSSVFGIFADQKSALVAEEKIKTEFKNFQTLILEIGK